MNALLPRPNFRTLQSLGIVYLALVSTGCGSLLQRTANLEDDELYLERGEAFVTDAEYLAYAYEQAGYNDAAGEYDDAEARSGDGFQSSFGYVPQSLRGRSMLRGYMTPYGAAGFGPNPYDPWGSSFYNGYGAYNPGFVDPYNTWGSAGMGGGWGTSAWGINPYVGGAWGMNGWGMNPYAYQPYGGGLYGPNPYGFGYAPGYANNAGFGSWGFEDGFQSGTPLVVAQRTPIWASSAINSNAGGRRLMTNKAGSEEISDQSTKTSRQPTTMWRAFNSSGESSRNAVRSTESTGRNSWRQWSDQGQTTGRPASTRPSSTRPSSNQNSSRSNSWSRPSSSGSSRGSGSAVRPSSSRSTGGSSGRSESGVSRGSGRGGHPSR